MTEDVINNFSLSDFEERPPTENGFEITKEYAEKRIKEYSGFLDKEIEDKKNDR